MPQQQPDKRILKLISVYQQARKRLLNIIFNTELNGTVATYQRAILSQVEAELTALNVDCRRWVQGTLPVFYEEGIENVNSFLIERGLPITGDFSKLNKKAVDIIIDNTIIDLTTANNFVGRRVKDDLREISLDVIGQKIATGSSVQQAKSMLIDRILNQGIAFIKDGKEQISIKNKSYQLDKYAEMVARSTTREATNRGTLNQLTNLGYDLVQMSWHNSPCPICAQYEGRIYSISGNDSRFPPLEFAYSSINSGGHANIHPNCRHILSPYIEEFADDLDHDIEFSREFLSDSEIQDRVSGYYEQQKEKRELYRDQRQYEKYKMVMGKKIGSFDKFRDKKQDPEEYEELKKQYREKKKELMRYE